MSAYKCVYVNMHFISTLNTLIIFKEQVMFCCPSRYYIGNKEPFNDFLNFLDCIFFQCFLLTLT